MHVREKSASVMSEDRIFMVMVDGVWDESRGCFRTANSEILGCHRIDEFGYEA